MRVAQADIEQLDVLPPLVVLDTKLYELDVTSARNLGLELPTPILSSTFSEFQSNASTSTSNRLGALQPLTRTPLSLQTAFNLLVQDGTARVLADPRITTLSGHTASIRAGDTIGILTTVGGGTGTYATSQIQTFQTGVTLDITPLVTPNNEVTVALHPVVNSLSGIVNGVPQISTRDTETTVHLKDNQTLVIGGLIEETVQKSVNKIPLLGNLPLIGGIFQNPQSSRTRNELVIVVTPHIITNPNEAPYPAASNLLASPLPLPTLPPDTPFPFTTPSATAIAPAAKPIPPSPPPVVAATPSAPLAMGNVFNPVLQVASSVNTFAYGQVPNSNQASATDPVRIFYAAMNPTSLPPGATLNLAATTTTNAAKVTLTLGSANLPLTQSNPGVWALTGTLPSNALSSAQTSMNAMLTATRSDGASASISIPLQLLK